MRVPRKLAFEGELAQIRWWRRPTAPLSIGSALAMWTLVVVPTVLGAVFAWQWWIVLAGLLPYVVLSTRLGWVAAEARGIKSRAQTPRLASAILGGFIGAVIGVTIPHLPERYAGLVIVVLTPITYLILLRLWRNYDPRTPTAGR